MLAVPIPASNFIPLSQKGVANGVATLDGSTLIPLVQIPATLTGKDADTLDTYHASSFSLVGHNHDTAYAPLSHVNVADAHLPSQTGNSGKFLTTNGLATSWAAVSGGTTDHSLLSNLAYALSGHTGFEPTLTKGNLTAGSNKISIGGTGTGALIGAGASVDIAEANITHNNLGGLTAGDPHTQYALLLGRAGGQTFIGGTASGDNLTLQSTSHATKGKILFGTSAYDEVNNWLGIYTATPECPFDVNTGNTPFSARIIQAYTGTGVSRAFIVENCPAPIGNQDGTISGFNTILSPSGAYNFADVDNGLGLVIGRYRLRFANAGASPTILKALGITVSLENNNVTSSSQTTVATAAAFNVDTLTSAAKLKYTTLSAFASVAPSGTGITNFIGLNLAKSTVATNNTMILLGTGTTGNFGIYENTGYDNYFAGNLLFPDDIKIKLGTGNDALIDYDSVNNSLDIDLATNGVNTGLRILSDGGTLSLDGSTGDWLLAGADKFQFGDNGTYIAQLTDGHLDLTADVSVDINANMDISAKNIITDITTGTIIFTAANQKGAFFGATPIAQPVNTTDLRTALINLGLLASGGATPLNLNAGALTAGSLALTTDLPITEGGTGQSTAQTAINALTDVASATNEYVLTKDTATGNAIFKVSAGGGSTHNFLSATHPDTVAASAVLGDTLYGNATPAWTKLAGNTTTTKKFLVQTGTGTVSAVPAWDVIAAGDLPTGIDAVKIGAGAVDNTEFGYLDGVTSAIQTQLNTKQAGEGHISIFPFNYSAIVQGSWAFSAISGSWGAHIFDNNSTPVIGDALDFQVYLAAGTYSLSVLYRKTTAAGIVEFYNTTDANSIGTIDAYAAAATNNNLTTLTSYAVATSGLKTIRMRSTTKNASSSNYVMVVNCFTFFKTA